MLTRLAVFLFSIQLLGLSAPGLTAQEGVPIRLLVEPETGSARIEIGDLVSDPLLLEAIHSGLPLRIRILVQLWKDGIFDSQEGQNQWKASVVFDPLTRRYRVQPLGGPGVEGELNTLEEVQGMFRQVLEVPVQPRRSGRYYYLADVRMETLSLSDLDELQRWLQGELAPAVAGDEDVGSALAQGVRRILVRVLGLPAKHFQVKSPSFVPERYSGTG